MSNPNRYVYYSAKRYIDPVIRLYFWNGKDRNPFHFSPSIDGDHQWMETVLLGKDAPYRDAVTTKLLEIEAAGLYRHKFVHDSLCEFGRVNKVPGKAQDDVFLNSDWTG